ncbi:MAG: hypothetical protein OXG54_09775, partial [Gammaproteobacteria bacterium]|nr:hypothetical protein [Gammaproteobacteria bacterium]
KICPDTASAGARPGFHRPVSSFVVTEWSPGINIDVIYPVQIGCPGPGLPENRKCRFYGSKENKHV